MAEKPKPDPNADLHRTLNNACRKWGAREIRLRYLPKPSSIINISSVAGIRYTGVPYSTYYATKAAMIHLTRTTAVQYAPKRIRVNTVLPGLMKTPMVEKTAGLAAEYGKGDIEEMWKVRDAQCPMGHMGDAWDVAYACLYLARQNQIGSDQLAILISTVHEVITSLGKPAQESEVERTPAVPIRRSVHRDYVVCLECGWRGQMLKRHLTTGHDLSVDQYRARWNLPREHPMTAPDYSEQRSSLAKQIGLGRGRAGGGRTSGEATEEAAPENSAGPQPRSRRRGRPRS
jgi:predicted transcriptional regulator